MTTFLLFILFVGVLFFALISDMNIQHNKEWMAFSKGEFGYEQNKYVAYEKCFKTIHSCKTTDQLLACYPLVSSFYSLYNDTFLYDDLYREIEICGNKNRLI